MVRFMTKTNLCFIYFFAVTCTLGATQECAMPKPSWFSKAPLNRKPDDGWWQQFLQEESPITLTRSTAQTLIEYQQQEKNNRPSIQRTNKASFAIVVFDPWVPWETDFRYLEAIDCIRDSSFLTTIHSPIAYPSRISIKHIPHHNHELVINLSEVIDAQTITEHYVTALRAAIILGSQEFFMPLLGHDGAAIGTALNNPQFKEELINAGLAITLIFKPDILHRSVNGDLALFNQLLEAFDALNNTRYHVDRPICFFISNYLAWAYKYEAEQATREVKPETIAGLHHMAEQMNILLKKIV